QIDRWHFRLGRQVVAARIAAHYEHRMRSPHARVHWVVKRGISHAATAQFLQTLFRFPAECVDFAELDGLGGTRLGASRNQSHLLAVITERTFEGAAVIFISLDHPEGTCDHAVAAAIANIRLNVYPAELGAHD